MDWTQVEQGFSSLLAKFFPFLMIFQSGARRTLKNEEKPYSSCVEIIFMHWFLAAKNPIYHFERPGPSLLYNKFMKAFLSSSITKALFGQKEIQKIAQNMLKWMVYQTTFLATKICNVENVFLFCRSCRIYVM